jgi:hypothetical protein
MAAILTITESGESEFKVYGAAEENERDKGMQTRRMVGVFSYFCAHRSTLTEPLQSTVPYFV